MSLNVSLILVNLVIPFRYPPLYRFLRDTDTRNKKNEEDNEVYNDKILI